MIIDKGIALPFSSNVSYLMKVLKLNYIIMTFAMISITSTTYGQEVIFEEAAERKNGTELFAVVNPTNQETSLFFKTNRKIKGFHLDKNFRVLTSLDGELSSEIDFPQQIGHTYSHGVLSLFFASSYYHTFEVLSYDYESKKVTNQIIELPLKNEQFAGSVSHNGKLYLFSAMKSSSTLKMYIFDNNKNYETRTYKFTDEDFGPDSQRFSSVLRKDQLTFIASNIPGSLSIASRKNKIYCYNNSIVITFDNQVSRTTMMTVDLTTLEADFTVYPQDATKCNELYSRSNSYIYNGFLYQVVYCAEKMVFKISNLEAGEKVKEFSVTENDEIEFKNGEIVQLDGGAIYSDGEREFSKTKQFLRKVIQKNGIVSAYQVPSGIIVTLGGVIEKSFASAAGPSGPGFPPPVNFGPSGTFTKSITFKSLLNASTFEHEKDGQISENNLERIEKYKNELGDEAKTLSGAILNEVIFGYGNSCIYGYYHRKNDRYILVRFDQP
ncbi:MAG TPA: hypothetical protein VFW11_08840 [Cyclobacteriaceae bacterium]|nr:hypothetical protein [Cyclobacteriaceae bacterium]